LFQSESSPVDKISPIPSSTSLLPGTVRHSVRLLSRQTEQKSSTPSIPRNYPTPRARHQWNVNVRSVSEDEAGSPSDMAVQSRTLGKTADATHLPSAEQRHFLVVFSVLAIIRLHFALSNSYIHPDEHFQGPEVVVGLNPGLFVIDFQDIYLVGRLHFLGNSQTTILLAVPFGAYCQYGWCMECLYGSSNPYTGVQRDVLTMLILANPDPMLLFRALRLTFYCLSFLNGIL
jgi:hypothetical protein